MSYTSPPTFVTGAYLSAAQLNILSDDIEYLRGQQLMPMTGMFRQDNLESWNNVSTSRGGWSVMHLTNTFRYRIVLVQGTSNLLRIHANGNLVYEDTNTRTRVNNTDYVWSATVSISSLPLTEGAIYGLQVTFRGPSGQNIVKVEYLGEDWTNTGYSNRSDPTFSNNAVLTAAQLNALSTDIKFLYDRSLRPNIGFYSGANIQSNSSSGAPAANERGGWSQLHVSNTLFYRTKLTQGDAFEWSIKMGGQTVYTNNDRINPANSNGPWTAPHEYEGTVNLASFGFTLGAVYDMSVSFKGYTEGVNQLNVSYIGEVW